MALNDFLNQTCTIKQTVKSIVWWEETKTETTIYSWIPCYYYNQSQRLNETENAINTDLSSYKVIIQPNRTLVRPEMIVEITDSDLWSIWRFKIEWVKINRLYDWSKDSIQLSLYKN